MGRRHAPLLPFFVLLAIFSANGPAFADSINLPQPEAPTTIFATKLGSADVDMTLLGSWDAAASFGTGLLFAPGQSVQVLDSFPSLDQGFVFTQTPDITASLEMMKRFFVSVSIIGSFANNYIQMGYRGGKGEALHEVIIGTQGITIPASTLMQIPAQPQGSIGAMAEFQSGGSTNDLLLRWDSTLPKTKTFIGKNELVEQETGINGYMRGMYFFLPDTNIDQGTLQVYIEDPNGTFFSNEIPVPRKYRLATFNDVVLDTTQGLVTMVNAVHGRVLVFYRKGGIPVGSTTIGRNGLPGETNPGGTPSQRLLTAPAENFDFTLSKYLGLDMSHRNVTLSGIGKTLLLWEPGDNSPFEIDSAYAFSANPPADVSKINIKLNLKDAAATLPTFTPIFQPDPPNKRFLVLQNQTLRSTFYNFYPFPDPLGLIYGPERDSLAGGLGYDIYVQMLTPVSGYVLEANIEPGSVTVTINGVAETRFQVEPVSGTLTLQVDVLPTDRIEVTYRKAEGGVSGGDILFAWRDTIPLSEDTDLSLGAGVRWNANPWTFSQTPYSKSGTVIGTVGIDGKSDNLQYSGEAGVSYTNPDTTGILLLFAMEGNSINVDLSEDNAYPASLPTEIGGLTQANRGILTYRDYRSYGPLGSSSLQTIETVPVPSALPYSSGSRMGPYNVTGSDGNLNPVSLVFEYDLDPTISGGDWVGANIPVNAGSDTDLSGARAITVRLRGLPTSGTVSVYLQIGSVSEDLDGSGVLKTKEATSDIGFTFVQADPPVTLEVGAGPQLKGDGKLDSEDRNSNGILDLEDQFRVITPTFTPDMTISTNISASWQNFTYALTDQDRQNLLQARSVRIVIVNNGYPARATGEILVDSVTIEATPFWPQTAAAADKANVQIQEVSENLARYQPSGGNFSSRFADTYNRFHPDGGTYQVLETIWGIPAGLSGPFTVQGFIPQGTSDEPLGTGGIQYETVVSYIRAGPSAGTTYTFSLLDSSSHGMVWSIANASIADNAWHEVKVSRKNNSVTIDGTDVGPPTQFDSSYGSLAQLQVTMAGPSGTAPPQSYIYIDDVYLTDPQSVFGAAMVGSISGTVPGTILSAGNTRILSNVAFRQDVALYSAGFAPLYGVPYAAEDLSSRSHLDSDIVIARTSLDLLLRDQGGSLSASGGHRVTVPDVTSPVVVMDAFSLSTTGGFTREDMVALTAGSAGSLSVDAAANASPDETDTSGLLTQTWLAGLTLSPLPPFGISSTLSLSQAVTGYPLAQEWYGARWATETGLLLPWMEGGDVTRAEKLGVKAGIPAAPLGVTLETDTGASGSNYSPTGFTQESDLSSALSFLYKLGQGDSSDSVGLSYRRSLSITTSPGPGPRFQQETDELTRIMSLQPYFLEGIPIVEIFSDNTGTVLPDWSSATQGTYSPSIDLSFQRSYGSRLADLFIPSNFDLAVGQDLKMNLELVQTDVYVRPRISTRAVNLFGRLGTHPLLPMVLTDDYSLSLNASVDDTTPTLYPQYGTGPILSHLSVQAQASFTGENNGELTLVEAVRLDQVGSIVLSNDSQAILDWRVQPAAGIPLPILPSDISATGRYEHRESAEVTVGYQDSGAFHPFTLLLGHATSLVYPGHGSIKATLNLGMDVENELAVGLAWRFAFRLALEAKLTF
ncbi:MAG: hypothetical protein ACLQDL_03965 [Spirochaetia bacterium]